MKYNELVNKMSTDRPLLGYFLIYRGFDEFPRWLSAINLVVPVTIFPDSKLIGQMGIYLRNQRKGVGN